MRQLRHAELGGDDVDVGVGVGAGVGVDVDVGVDDLDNVAVFCLSSPPPIHFLSLFIKESLRYTC